METLLTRQKRKYNFALLFFFIQGMNITGQKKFRHVFIDKVNIT